MRISEIQIGFRYRKDLGKLKQTQTAERQRLEHSQTAERRTLQTEHSRQSQERARDIKEGRDREQFRKEMGQDLKGEFARRVRERIKETKKRREEERKRGKDRGGGRERE